MPKLKPTCPRKTKNTWSPWNQSGGWKGRRTVFHFATDMSAGCSVHKSVSLSVQKLKNYCKQMLYMAWIGVTENAKSYLILVTFNHESYFSTKQFAIYLENRRSDFDVGLKPRSHCVRRRASTQCVWTLQQKSTCSITTSRYGAVNSVNDVQSSVHTAYNGAVRLSASTYGDGRQRNATCGMLRPSMYEDVECVNAAVEINVLDYNFAVR